MTDQLLKSIKDTSDIIEYANEIEQAIVSLSKYEAATGVLTQELRRLVALGESNWQEIEQTDEFKTNFENRTQALSAFISLQDAE